MGYMSLLQLERVASVRVCTVCAEASGPQFSFGINFPSTLVWTLSFEHFSVGHLSTVIFCCN
jgi:hypothetical protein